MCELTFSLDRQTGALVHRWKRVGGRSITAEERARYHLLIRHAAVYVADPHRPLVASVERLRTGLRQVAKRARAWLLPR